MGSKVTQGSLEVNLFTTHMTLGSVVVLNKFGDHSTLFVAEKVF